MYICGCLCLLLMGAVLVAIVANFYLGDKTDYLEFKEKKLGLPSLAFLGLALLCLIAFGFYWGWRPDDDIPKTNPNNPDVIYS